VENLPRLDTIKSIVTKKATDAANAAVVGMADGVAKRAYNTTRDSTANHERSRIAQEIIQQKVVAYLLNPNSGFEALPREHELMLQMKSYLAEGVKTKDERCFTGNSFITGEARFSVLTKRVNLDWLDRVYIPVDSVLSAKHTPPEQMESIETPKKESARKTDNLLRALVCIAADAYGYNPASGKSTAPADIAGAISKYSGGEFSPDAKTIKGWLKEGAALLPPNPQQD
jgi:hypothetical protein